MDLGAAITDAFDDLTRVKTDYASDPVRWADEQAHTFLWSRQRMILESVRDNRRTAVHSCHNVGKTFTSAVAAMWWIFSHPPGEAFVISTAPTAVQVKSLLWREIGRLHSKASLSGRTNQTELYLPAGDGEELVAFGRTTSEHNEAAFNGIHARYVLVILDEASGVPEPIWNAAESIASNKHSRILAIANPDVPTGPFADACSESSPYNTIHIGYEHTPSVTGEDVPAELLDYLISSEWAEDRKQAWGENSALYQAKVLGQFPTGEFDPWRVIAESDVALCRYIEPAYDPEPQRWGGLDVGGGDDRTVLIERINDAVGRIESFQESDPMKSAERLAHLIVEWNLTRVNIDSIGVGWGLAGSLRKQFSDWRQEGSLTYDITVNGVNFAARASQPKKYYNARAAAWWNGRELARDQKWSLANLDDDAVAELTMPRYELRNGKILIEPKADVRERLGRSPDIADALLLAFFDAMYVPPVSDARTAFAAADLTTGAGTRAATVFPGLGIPGFPTSIPTSLTGRLTR